MTEEETTVHHDAKRCPECDSVGKIVDRLTRTNEWARNTEMGKVRRRTYECFECEQRWNYYV